MAYSKEPSLLISLEHKDWKPFTSTGWRLFLGKKLLKGKFNNNQLTNPIILPPIKASQ